MMRCSLVNTREADAAHSYRAVVFVRLVFAEYAYVKCVYAIRVGARLFLVLLRVSMPVSQPCCRR
eukprot:5136837-Pleurochrysis_carterae.AAC.1